MKPCPFCGSSRLENLDAARGGAVLPARVAPVICCDCGARGPSRFVAASGLEAWDSRAAPEDGLTALVPDVVLAQVKPEERYECPKCKREVRLNEADKTVSHEVPECAWFTALNAETEMYSYVSEVGSDGNLRPVIYGKGGSS